MAKLSPEADASISAVILGRRLHLPKSEATASCTGHVVAAGLASAALASTVAWEIDALRRPACVAPR
jgi:hypothetical protein